MAVAGTKLAPTRKPCRAYHSFACASVQRGPAIAVEPWLMSTTSNTKGNEIRLGNMQDPFAL